MLAYSLAIKAAQHGNKTVVIPLIWAICDKFKIFNFKNEEEVCQKNKDIISDSIKWIFEIERFNVFWNEIGFQGQSLTLSFFEIARKIRDEEIKDVATFSKSLISTIAGLKFLDNEKRNKQLENKLIEKYKNHPYSKYNNNVMWIYLARINFYLNNKCNMFFNVEYNFWKTYKDEYFDPNQKMDIEHNWPQKLKKDSAIEYNEENISEGSFNEEYDKYIQKIGNLSLLEHPENAKVGNKNGSDKSSENANEDLKITNGYENNGVSLRKLKPDDNNWKTIKDHIDNRSNELINILLKMYSYDETKSQVEDLEQESTD